MKLETALLHNHNIIEYLHNRGGVTVLPAMGGSGLEIESGHFWTLDPTAPGSDQIGLRSRYNSTRAMGKSWRWSVRIQREQGS
jgi:hypothetical protein